MPHLRYVPITNAVQDFIQDNDLPHEEVEEQLLIKWAVDALRMVYTPRQFKHKIALLPVINSRAELPADFEIIGQAAANEYPYEYCDCKNDPDNECCNRSTRTHGSSTNPGRREDVIQWVQGTREPNCDIEINLVCDNCGSSQCECDSNTIVVDVDRTWELSHPEYYYSHHNRVGRFGYGPSALSGYYRNPESKFQLMRYASNDFHKLKYLIGECPNVDCTQCVHEFVINLPYIEVDFERGEVLISYLASVSDENGDPMMPDNPNVHAAIFWHLTSKWYWKKNDMAKFQTAQVMRDDNIRIAKSTLEFPSFMEIKNYLENQHLKRIPNFHRHDHAGQLSPDEYEIYKERLEGKRPRNR